MIAVIFDLDNTLFNVEQYFSGAFYKISNYLTNISNIPKQKIYSTLMDIWKKKTSMHPYLFNDLLKAFNLNENVFKLVKIFNEFDGKLRPYDDVIPTLKKLKKAKHKLGIITDGNVERQKRKIGILGITSFFDVIIYTNDLNSPKPSVFPFRKAIELLKVLPKDSFYIGDNPLLDFKGSKDIGMITIRIKKGEFSSIPKNKYIDLEIESINEVLNVIDNC